ncbi:MAG: ethanolamine utilization protein EutN [Planctomycetes bacterium]|nr:ethanolamine utilization protein EutN [Planctomycetota bacterium]
MQLGLVIGKATATIKHPSVRGQRLLLIQPLMADERRPDGFPLLVVDTLGAAVGETVMMTSDGRGARQLLKDDLSPVRWTTLGIRD